mgnify:CR=1 FL=1
MEVSVYSAKSILGLDGAYHSILVWGGWGVVR